MVRVISGVSYHYITVVETSSVLKLRLTSKENDIGIRINL